MFSKITPKKEQVMIDTSIYLLNPLKINEICRTCLGRKGEMQPIFDACLDEMMNSVLTFPIKRGDGYPELICKQCVLAISRAYAFKQTCEKSARILKEFMSAEFQAQLAAHENALQFNENVTKNPLEQQEYILPTDSTAGCSDHDDPEPSEVGVIEIGGYSDTAELSLTTNKDSNIQVLQPGDYIAVTNCGPDKETPQNVNFINFHTGEVLCLAQSVSPTHVFEISPDGLAKLIPKNDVDRTVDLEKPYDLDKPPESPSITEEKSSGKFVCQKCGETFTLKVDYKLHMILHPLEKSCPTCGKCFSENRALKRHLKTHLLQKPHVCNICNKAFAESSNLTKHKKRHTGELRNVQGKPHLCSVCGRGFKWATSLSKHSKYHTGNKLLKCKFCPKQYVESRSLDVHLRSHTGEKPFTCNVCSKGFTQQCNLEKHLRVHTGEKPFVCSVCGKGFSQRGYVAVHMRIHTGEKPFICNICGKAFAGANTLTIHQRVHTGEKPYECNTCNKTFSRHESLVIHQRTHTGEKPHVCTVCEKGFTTSGHLSGHMRSHTGERPYSCNMCDKRFAGSGSLKIHMRMHTGEKPYVCRTCGKAFTQSSSLSTHSLSHGSEQTVLMVEGQPHQLTILRTKSQETGKTEITYINKPSTQIGLEPHFAIVENKHISMVESKGNVTVIKNDSADIPPPIPWV